MFGALATRRKHSFKINEEASDLNVWKPLLDQLRCAVQFALVMRGLSLAVSTECCQPSIGGAVGMAHQKNLRRFVQQNRHPHLLQNKVALKVIAWRGQSFRTASDNDHVGAQNSCALQKLVHRLANALIEATEHGRISYIRIGGGIEVEGLLHAV